MLSRGWREIDVVMALQESDARTLMNLFGEDYYIDREAVVRAIQQRSIFSTSSTKTA